ncbi:MAG: serine hydrolase [Bacteroidales bacterium]|nr:serine hydrolase [Bacteroidales bacterium]MDD4656870.1 serine hydrolase [Bacteroidales bacterium]
MKIIKVISVFVLFFLFDGALAQSNNNYTQQADSICNVVFSKWNLPGMAVVIIKDGKEMLLKGYGKSDYSTNGKEITPETQFVIASTTKAMTAALLATVIDNGKVNWNDTVINHLPDFKLYDPWVTQNFLIKDIMVHRTGFTAYAGDDLPHFGYNRDQLYTLLRHIRPTYSFRTKYAYNNAMYTVAAKLIEKHYNVSWDQAIETYLFKPLEMSSSTTGKNAYFNNERLAKGHRHYKEGDSIKFKLREDTLRGYAWLSAIAPAGFVVTTAKDMGNWLKMNINNGVFNGNRVISKESHSFLTTPQTITSSDSVTINNYAQGWTVEQGPSGRLIRHTGLAYGYTALVAQMPELNMGIAILTNAGNTTTPHMAIAREIVELVSNTDNRDWVEHYLNRFMKPSTKKPTKEQQDTTTHKRLELYTGNYFKPDFGEVIISLKEDKLFFSLNKIKSELKHKTGNTFTMVVPGVGKVEVNFFAGTNVPIESLTFNIGDPIGKFYKEPF